MCACICRGITEEAVRRVGKYGISTPDALIAHLSLDDRRCCGRCAREVQRFEALAAQGAAVVRSAVLLPVLA